MEKGDTNYLLYPLSGNIKSIVTVDFIQYFEYRKLYKQVELRYLMSDEFQQVELLDLEIESILSFFIGVLSTKSLQYLGVPVKQGEEPEKDLQKARLAIDTTSFIVEKIEPYIDQEELDQLKQVVSNLQFAYLRESN